jgi:hypothetical protein
MRRLLCAAHQCPNPRAVIRLHVEGDTAITVRLCADHERTLPWAYTAEAARHANVRPIRRRRWNVAVATTKEE